jgi:hypothetical protein
MSNKRDAVSGFVRPSINYGSVAGSGAKFIGQGILNLYRDPRITWPFTPFILGNQVKITSGHANGIPVPRFSGGVTVGYYKVVITTDGQVVTSAEIQVGNPEAQTPEEDSYPTTVEVPIVEVEAVPNTANAYYARRMTGAGGISLTPYVAAYLGAGCNKTAKYAWAVFT